MPIPSRRLTAAGQSVTATLADEDIIVERGDWIVINHDTGFAAVMSIDQIMMFDAVATKPVTNGHDKSTETTVAKTGKLPRSNVRVSVCDRPVPSQVLRCVGAVRRALEASGWTGVTTVEVRRFCHNEDSANIPARLNEAMKMGLVSTAKLPGFEQQWTLTDRGGVALTEGLSTVEAHLREHKSSMSYNKTATT